MILNCQNCQAEVPEGANACPSCGAGLGTVMFGKGRGLSRTLIGKAIELRNSIPWASASMVMLVEDEGGKKKVRPAGLVGVLAVLALLVGGGGWLFHKPKAIEAVKEAAEVAEEKVAPAKPEPTPAPAPARPAPVEIPRGERAGTVPAPAPAHPNKPAPAKKSGTLLVSAVFKGKPVGAKVLINGEEKGITPVTVSLPANKYTLVIEKAGYKREKRAGVTVQAGKKAILKVALQK